VRIPIEEETGPMIDYPAAGPGTYHMRIIAWKQDVETKNGIRDVVDFSGDDAEGNACGISLWLRGPETRNDGTKSKGNLWQYRKLAEAIGAQALEQYRTKGPDGGSIFNPMDWRDVYVKVTVGNYKGVDDVDPADLEFLKRQREASTRSDQQGSRGHVPVADDDIPF